MVEPNHCSYQDYIYHQSVVKVWFQPVPLTSGCLSGNCQLKVYVLPSAWCLLITTCKVQVLSCRNLMSKTLWWAFDEHTNWLWAGEDGFYDRFSFTGHQSLSLPVSLQSIGNYLPQRTPQTKCVHCNVLLSLSGLGLWSVKPQRLCLDWTSKSSHQSWWWRWEWMYLCPLVSANISRSSVSPGLFLWRKVPAEPGDCCSILCSSQLPGKGCKENLHLYPLPVTLPLTVLRVAVLDCPGTCRALLGGHSAAGCFQKGWGGECTQPSHSGM